MAHRLSRTSRGRAIRQADVRVGKHRGGTMNMATLRPKQQAKFVAPTRPQRLPYPTCVAACIDTYDKEGFPGYWSCVKACMKLPTPSGGAPPKPKGFRG